MKRSESILGRASNKRAFEEARQTRRCFAVICFRTYYGKTLYSDHNYLGPREKIQPYIPRTGAKSLRYRIIVTPK